MRLAVILLAGSLAAGCRQREEQWAIKQSAESAKFQSNFMRGKISDEEGGTQDDVDRFANKSFSATSDFDTSNVEYGEMETRGFLGGRKKSTDSSTRHSTKSVEPQMWKGEKDYSGPSEFGTSPSSFASRNWQPRKDEYYHVADLSPRSAKKKFTAGDYVTAGTEAARDDILIGRANDPVTAGALQKKVEKTGTPDSFKTPAVSLEQVRQMLGRE